ncbi:MAG: sigma 54-interacting transcriptional regulator [Planctomycetota bacterium]
MDSTRALPERFEVMRKIASGGAGELFLVSETGGETSVLKVLRPRYEDPGLEPLFRREFVLLSDIRHDSIVRVREFGKLPTGEPYFTMDYVPGENCRVFVNEARLDAAGYLRLAARLLDALAHVHARGILHRDIKPENVVMRQMGEQLTPVLVDFGLSVMSGAVAPGEATGTVPYIAPEILAGARADARADLFAVGMLLFEVATGQQPASRRELLRQAASSLAPENVRRVMRVASRGPVPPRFEEFVSRLLAPTPAARYSSATAALEALAHLYGADVEYEVPTETAASVDVQAPLVGRADALAALLQRVGELQDNTLLDPIVVVSGEAGCGVSRLLTTLRNHAAVAGCVVCSGHDLHSLVTDLATHHRVHGRPPSPSEDAAAAVFRVGAFLQGLQVNESPVLVLDDVHKMSEEACDTLRQWIGTLEGQSSRSRLLLVLGGSNDGDTPGVRLLKTCGRSVPLELRNLAPLGHADIRQALSVMLGGGRPAASVVQALLRASSGNARQFGELIHVLAAKRVLDVENGEPVLKPERLKAIELPHGVAEAARIRSGVLAPGPRHVLRKIALLEAPLRLGVAEQLGSPAIAELLAAELLVLDRGRVRFPDELARKAADSLRGAVREEARTDLAETIAEAEPAFAARLFADSGALGRARELGVPAARALISQRRLGEASGLLQHLLGDPPDIRVAEVLAGAWLALGSTEKLVTLGTRMVEECFDELDIDFALKICSALRNTNRVEEGLALLGRFDRGGTGEEAARVLNAMAAFLGALRRHDEAHIASNRAEAAAGDVLGLNGRIAQVRAQICRRQGRRRSAARLDGLVAKVPAGSVDFVARHAAHLNLALDHFRNGRARQALLEMRDAERFAVDAGRTVAAARAWNEMGRLMNDLGRSRSALRLCSRARAAFEEAASVVLVRDCLLSEAASLVELGRPAEAEARLSRAASLPIDERQASLSGSVDNEVRARVKLLAGRPLDATELYKSQIGAGRGTYDSVDGAIGVAECALVAGDTENAEAAWRSALRHLWEARAKKSLPRIRVGLAECAARHGAWNLAERFVSRAHEQFTWRTTVGARALMLRSGAALQRGDAAASGRLLEQSVAAANRTHNVPLQADLYAASASMLQEVTMQRHLRKPTGAAAAELLSAAREVWTLFGNEAMLRKIDLSLAELPRGAGIATNDPDADKLVKILHIVREMNCEFDRDRLLGLILDRAIELTGAERGFVVLLLEGQEQVHLARNLDRERISEPEQKMSSRIVQEVIRTGRIVLTEDAEADSRFDEFFSVRRLHLRSVIAVPFRSKGKTVGALYLDNRFRAGNFTEREERLLELFADQAVAAIDKAELIHMLEGQTHEIESLNRDLKSRISKQRRELSRAETEISAHRKARGWGFDRIVARSVTMQSLVREAKRVAASEIPVLLTGDNGTGKEILARAMHYASTRQARPFLAVNCAAFPEGLLEAEMFGHVRGSFTGADRDRAGLFEEADGGTLLLDEVGEMSPAMQVKLLRALESGEVKRIGESKVRTVDVRVIAATNADLEERMRNGQFRDDLYYRISGFVLRLPPLRGRLEDVEPLAYAFMEEASRREGRPDLTLSNEAIARLESYNWPGNVRELRNVILRGVVNAAGDSVGPDDIAFDARTSTVMPGLDPARADRILVDLTNRDIDINRRQQTAVTRCLTRGRISFGEYQRLFRISKSTTARDLESLVSLQLLEKRGKTRAVTYLPGPKLREIAKGVGVE